jgi:hypothetical protein
MAATSDSTTFSGGQLRLQGMEVLGSNPEGFEQRIKKDTAGWHAVLQGSGAGK